jgi:hypothetical protein
MPLQDGFSLTPHALAAIETSFSPARFSGYVRICGDRQKALRLYRWNTSLSQSLYWPMQTLEVVVRNSLSAILIERYGPDWHYSAKLRGQLDEEERTKLSSAVVRQQWSRKVNPVPLDPVVADISFGFWTALLTARYDVPIGWATRLSRAFPHLPANTQRQAVSRPMDDVRSLRNRIAHHEPIYKMKLEIHYREMMNLIGGICPTSKWLIEQTCSFNRAFADKPDI